MASEDKGDGEKMNNIKWIEKWYKDNCDGDWEHFYGIKIETLDNPGWHVEVHLNEGEYNAGETKEIGWDNGEDDWLNCSIKNEIFSGYGDCLKLEIIVGILRKWLSDGTDAEII